MKNLFLIVTGLALAGAGVLMLTKKKNGNVEDIQNIKKNQMQTTPAADGGGGDVLTGLEDDEPKIGDFPIIIDEFPQRTGTAIA